MDHGFTREHFGLLRQWGGHHYDADDVGKANAYARLKQAYSATGDWAAALQARLFPLGEIEMRNAPINQGQAFSRYTWAKVYPSPSSPKALAYTVGIDGDGFTVKIDTVGRTPARGAYEALIGGSNTGSPIAELLSAEAGLELSFEQLVAWSADAIARFEMSYGEVIERIGIGFPKLTLIADVAASEQGFAAWRQCLQTGAIRKHALFWLLEGGIVFRPTKSGGAAHGNGMELGTDPTGRTWAVQINDPRIPGDHNSGSAIAVDAAGERFLLRQGLLRPSEPGGRTISGAEFVSRTGLTPVPVEAEGLAARRLWFQVCSLDADPNEIRLTTSRFVDRCAAARDSADAGAAPVETGPGELFSNPETGGSHRRSARAAVEERTFLRRQGTVWLALAEKLSHAGIRVRKGRHPLGYEVDAEIDGGGISPLLVEIKTGISSGEIHGGVGQLHLYPRLIPRLAGYERALLLPCLPAPDVQSAVTDCGIAIYTFALLEPEVDAPEVTFSPDFLRRCGIDAR